LREGVDLHDGIGGQISAEGNGTASSIRIIGGIGGDRVDRLCHSSTDSCRKEEARFGRPFKQRDVAVVEALGVSPVLRFVDEVAKTSRMAR
jgi:hypothetical protein